MNSSRLKPLIAIFTIFILSCGGGSSGDHATPNAQLDGSWHLNLTSTSGRSSSEEVFIVQNSTTLSSDQVLSGLAVCGSVGTLAGSVSGKNIHFVITSERADTLTIAGISTDAKSFSGTYSTTDTGTCDLTAESGTFLATLIPPLQGTWTGTTQSTQYPPGATTFTANLTEDSLGKIAGTVMFTGTSGSSSSCSSLISGPYTGQQTGSGFYITDNQADGLFLGGTMDTVAKNISGGYLISACGGDNGSVTMTRP